MDQIVDFFGIDISKEKLAYLAPFVISNNFLLFFDQEKNICNRNKAIDMHLSFDPYNMPIIKNFWSNSYLNENFKTVYPITINYKEITYKDDWIKGVTTSFSDGGAILTLFRDGRDIIKKYELKTNDFDKFMYYLVKTYLERDLFMAGNTATRTISTPFKKFPASFYLPNANFKNIFVFLQNNL